MRPITALIRTCLAAALLVAGTATARADWVHHGEASLNRISVANANRIIGVNSADGIYMYGGSFNWVQLSGAATDVSTSADGSFWVVNRAGNIYREGPGGWQQIAGPTDGGTPQHIAVGSAGNVWLTTTTDSIHRWTGSGWTKMPGALRRIAVASDGTVMGVNAGGQVWKWSGSDWVQWPSSPGSPFVQISAGSATLVWAVSADSSIYRWTGSGWSIVPGGLIWVAVGADGLVWGVNAANQVFRWEGAAPGTTAPPAAACAMPTAGTFPSAAATVTPHCAGGRHIFSVQMGNGVSSVALNASNCGGTVSEGTFSTAQVPSFFAWYPESNFSAPFASSWLGAKASATGAAATGWSAVTPACPTPGAELVSPKPWDGSFEIAPTRVVVFVGSSRNLFMTTPVAVNKYMQLATAQTWGYVDDIRAATQFWLMPLPARSFSFGGGARTYLPFALLASNGKWVQAGPNGVWTVGGNSVSEASAFVVTGSNLAVVGSSPVLPIENSYGQRGEGSSGCYMFSNSGSNQVKCNVAAGSEPAILQIRGAP